ncbi:no significant database match found, partial [Pseudomonas fluorescens]
CLKIPNKPRLLWPAWPQKSCVATAPRPFRKNWQVRLWLNLRPASKRVPTWRPRPVTSSTATSTTPLPRPSRPRYSPNRTKNGVS